jgi:hypothetical protein
MATTHAPVTDPKTAIKMLREEHDRLGELLLLCVDLIIDCQAGRRDARTLKVAGVRPLAGRRLRRSVIEREAALAALDPDRDLAERALAQRLMNVLDDERDAEIIMLCERRMPTRNTEANTPTGSPRASSGIDSACKRA